jgi:hypothetical protein
MGGTEVRRGAASSYLFGWDDCNGVFLGNGDMVRLDFTLVALHRHTELRSKEIQHDYRPETRGAPALRGVGRAAHTLTMFATEAGEAACDSSRTV